jgi:hypothetical protein
MENKKQIKDYNSYMSKYLKVNTRRISLNLSLINDKDILQAIQETDPKNIQGAIKTLIRRGLTSTLL